MDIGRGGAPAHLCVYVDACTSSTLSVDVFIDLALVVNLGNMLVN